MERLWDAKLADRAAAIDQATRLGGVVIKPPKQTGFGGSQPAPPKPPDD